jgi:tRNA G18 (ribose-2'-O)-methylase SpoU
VVATPVPVAFNQKADSSAVIAGLLDNIRSIHNVGSMFRSADGAGLRHLYLNGITATPAQPKLTKAALGAQERVPWSYDSNGPRLAFSLKEQGYQLVAVETSERAQPLFGTGFASVTTPLVIVVGNERAGIDPGVLAHCDIVVSLPMDGTKRSLNVAVAFGIVAYTLRYGPYTQPVRGA